jgi:hypothetical protein
MLTYTHTAAELLATFDIQPVEMSASNDVAISDASGNHTEECRNCGAAATDATLTFCTKGFYLASCNVCGHADNYDWGF